MLSLKQKLPTVQQKCTACPEKNEESMAYHFIRWIFKYLS